MIGISAMTLQKVAVLFFAMLGVPAIAAAMANETPNAHRIDHVIAKVEERQLRSDEQTPWVLMHAAIAFGAEATVYDAEAQEEVGVIEYLLTRAKYEDRRIFRVAGGTPVVPRVPAVEHHINQYLMMLALVGVPPEAPLIADSGEIYRVTDLIEAAKLGFEDEQEVGWTLVVFSTYLSFDDQWTAANGRVYSIEDVLEIGIERDPLAEAEGGAHHLFGVAYAYRTYAREHGVLEGTWREAKMYLEQHAATARRYQQEDGALSGKPLAESVAPESPSDFVFSTGHTLEWLSLALSRDDLERPWVERVVGRPCQEVERYPVEEFSDGGIYHAVSALHFYQDRLSDPGANSR